MGLICFFGIDIEKSQPTFFFFLATFSQSCLSPLKISGVCVNCPTLHNKAE